MKMRNRNLLVFFLLLAIFMIFQGCALLKGSGTTSSTSSETSSKSSIQQSTSTIINAGSNEMNSTSSTPQSTSSKMDTAYEPLAMTDDGSFKVSAGIAGYNLRNFILLLKDKNIPIIEIKGSSKVFLYDGGSVSFRDANWDHAFSAQMDSLYDVNALDGLIQKQEIEAVYVKTPYEVYCFRQSLADPGAIVSIEGFLSDIIVTSNPRFVTEKEIKIGDNFAKAEKAYGFNDDDIIKTSDSDWRGYAMFNAYIIMFDGTKDGITSITLGRRPASGT